MRWLSPGMAWNGPMAPRAKAGLLGVVLLPVGLATHEVLHLDGFTLLGERATLVTAEWPMRLVDVRLFSLHATTSGPVPLGVQVADNALGPPLTALVFVLLRATSETSSRSALAVVVVVQLFFAVIQTAYPLLERATGLDADLLLAPELTNGPVLLILLAVTLRSVPGRRDGVPDTVRAPR